MSAVRGEQLPGYVAWLPDRVVTLHRDQPAWHVERLRAFGDDDDHRALWTLMDRLADVFWQASRAGIRLPIRRGGDIMHNARAVGWSNLGLARYLFTTMGEALQRFRLGGDLALRGLLDMLLQDTVHSGVARAPLVNAALGVTIRGAGLTRHDGGMHGFWRTLVEHYRSLGGQLRTATTVSHVDSRADGFEVMSQRGVVAAAQVVLAVPAVRAAQLCSGHTLARRLRHYVDRDRDELGGAVVAFLGVPEAEVDGQAFTHHQLLHNYAQPLGDGNNMFISVSAGGDTVSAPAAYRAVMISTHTALSSWSDLDDSTYTQRKKEIGERLVGHARRVYPSLGDRAVVLEVGTPRAYERFGFRPAGAVGGPHQTLANTNQFAIPHDLGGRGLWLVGDSTWPGLGTVACVLGSRIVADGVRRERRREHR